MSTSPRSRGGALLHVAVGVVLLAMVPKVLALWSIEPSTATSSAKVAAPAAAPTSAPEPAVGSVSPRGAVASEAAAEREHRLELPDGTFVAALNGAVDPAPLSMYWGNWPWSPIVGVERGSGIDWYRHEDGSYSTTQMVWRPDLGRHAAMTRVAHPGPTAPPVAPDDDRGGR